MKGSKYRLIANSLLPIVVILLCHLSVNADSSPDRSISLALDIIHSVGPGGTFLTHQHTLNHMRDQSRNGLFNRRNLEDWLEECAGVSLLDKAYAKAQDILEAHLPPELPIGADLAMKEIVREFETKADTIERRKSSYAISA